MGTKYVRPSARGSTCLLAAWGCESELDSKVWKDQQHPMWLSRLHDRPADADKAKVLLSALLLSRLRSVAAVLLWLSSPS